jgi:CHAD domain-containing protein
MALKIKRKETAGHAVRRIGRRLAANALKSLRDCDTLEAVHEVRKDIKQARALLRLVQRDLKSRACRRVTKKLKKTASALAPSRDAFVKASALAELTSHFKRDISPRALEGIRRVLVKDCRKEQRKLPRDLKRSRWLLKKICREFGSIEAARSGWKVIGPGIKRSYRAGRRACRLARKTGAPEDFHEWRKNAKDLLYQVRFLCGIWPEQMDALETELDRLGDHLGDAHDLTVLTARETLKQLANQPREKIEMLKALAGRRQKELHTKALRLGAKLYHERSVSFCQRLHQYWRRWRRNAAPAQATAH